MIANLCQHPPQSDTLTHSAGARETLDPLFEYEGGVRLSDLSLPWKVERADSCETANDAGELTIDHSPNELGQRSAAVRKLDFNIWRRRLIVEATLKVDCCDKTGGVVLGFCNGRRQEHITFFPDRFELRHAELSVPANLSDSFFTCRLELDGDDLLVYLDDVLALNACGRCTHPGARPPGVEFGTITPSARGRSIWKSVRAFLGSESDIAPPRLHPARHLTIYKQKGTFPLFPHLIQTLDGRLHVDCVLRGSSSHMNVEGSAISLSSSDEGETWQPTSGTPVNPARIGADGVLAYANAIGWRYSDDKALAAKLESEGAELRWRGNEFAYAQGCFGARSLDNGKTWTTSPIAFPRAGLLMHFHEAATLLRLDKHTLLRAVYTKETAGPDRSYYEPYVLRSDDNGLSWEVIRIHSDPFKNLAFGETALVKAPNRDILAMMRQEPAVPNASLWISRRLPFWLARSSDGGKTWSQPVETGIVGHPASLITRRDGTIVCTYGYRLHPMGIRAATSKDNGVTWDHVGELILRADGSGSPADNGYPITVEKKSGGLFTCYYLTDPEGVPYIAGTHWDI